MLNKHDQWLEKYGVKMRGKKGSFKLTARDGVERECPAMLYGLYVVHGVSRIGYSVSHVPTGLYVVSFDMHKPAVGFARFANKHYPFQTQLELQEFTAEIKALSHDWNYGTLGANVDLYPRFSLEG